jgi:hypothetical protein
MPILGHVVEADSCDCGSFAICSAMSTSFKIPMSSSEWIARLKVSQGWNSVNWWNQTNVIISLDR